MNLPTTSKELTIKLYQTISDSNEQRVFEKWHASSIAECPRCQYMKRLGVERTSTPSAAKILRWTAGHNMETAIREHIKTIFPDVTSNVRLDSKKWDLTGEYDNLVGDTIIEIKSVHDMAFIERDGECWLKEQTGTRQYGNKEQKTWGAKKSPYAHHELQNHCYVLLLQEKQIYVNNIIYVYISLSGRLCVYVTQVDKTKLDWVKKRLESLHDAWSSKTPPECHCNQTDNPLYDGVLKWCDYKNADGSCCVIPEGE